MEKIEAFGFADSARGGAAAQKPEEKQWFSAFYGRLKRPVYLLALSILRDSGLAEDVMQQTFLQAMEHAGSFSPGTNKKAWVMTIAHNLAINCLKKREREGLTLDDYLASERGAEQVPDGSEDYLAAMAILDSTERTVVTLKAICCLRHAQIARIAGISVVDCRAKYARALKKLKKHYLDNGYRKDERNV